MERREGAGVRTGETRARPGALRRGRSRAFDPRELKTSGQFSQVQKAVIKTEWPMAHAVISNKFLRRPSLRKDSSLIDERSDPRRVGHPPGVVSGSARHSVCNHGLRQPTRRQYRRARRTRREDERPETGVSDFRHPRWRPSADQRFTLNTVQPLHVQRMFRPESSGSSTSIFSEIKCNYRFMLTASDLNGKYSRQEPKYYD